MRKTLVVEVVLGYCSNKIRRGQYINLLPMGRWCLTGVMSRAGIIISDSWVTFSILGPPTQPLPRPNTVVWLGLINPDGPTGLEWHNKWNRFWEKFVFITNIGEKKKPFNFKMSLGAMDHFYSRGLSMTWRRCIFFSMGANNKFDTIEPN